MDPSLVCPYGVTLAYLYELGSTVQSNILAKGVELYTLKMPITLKDGTTLETGTTLHMSRRKGLFSKAKMRTAGVDFSFEVPRSKILFKNRSFWDVSDVKEYVVKPAVQERSCALASVLDARHVCDVEYKCFYLSVPSTGRLSKVIEALKEFFDGEDDDPTSIYIWFEVTNVNPFAVQSGEILEEYENTIVDRVQACVDHLVFADRWGYRESRSPANASFEDAKVLWEIACARDDDMDTYVILPGEAHRDMRNSMRAHGLTFFERMTNAISIADAVGLVHLESIVKASARQAARELAAEKATEKDVDEKDSDPESEDEPSPDADAIPAEDDPDNWTSKQLAKEYTLVNRVIVKQLEIWFMHEFADEVPKLAERKDIQFEPAAKAINRIAVMHSRNGEISEAIILFDYVIQFLRLGQFKTHSSLAFALNNKALLLQRQNNLDEAIPLLQEAVDILEQIQDSEAMIAILVNNLITMYETIGDYDGAEEQLRRLVELNAKAYGMKSTKVALSLNHLGAVQIKLGDVSSAKKNLLQALSILEKDLDITEDDPNLAAVIDDLATIYDIETDHTAGDGSGHHRTVAATLLQLATVYKQEHSRDSHTRASKRGLKILSDVLGADHPETQKYERDLLLE